MRLSPFRHHGILADLEGANRLSSHRHASREDGRASVVLVVGCCQLQEALLEGDVERSYLSARLAILFEILNYSTSRDAIWATARVVVVVSIDALQSLEILHNLNRMLSIFKFYYLSSISSCHAILTLSINASCESSSDFLLHVRFSSVDAKMCEIVPKRWNNMAVN